MKILVLCDQGNNRSVTVASQLKYWGHDVIPAGIQTNSIDTLMMLYQWADRIITTDRDQMLPWNDHDAVPPAMPPFEKVQLWNIGPDVYKRPFNPELLAIVKGLMQQHASEYKP